jgi:hypothetical protein
MSAIGGKKKETQNYEGGQASSKYIGLFEGKVVAVNPDLEQYKEILGMEIKEDSKALDYIGENADGYKTLRIDFWLEEIKNKEKFKITFFLEDRERENKDGSKKQYINSIGMCSWASDENLLQDWFKKDREYREAFVGEEDLYTFMRTWLGNLDYRDAETTLSLDFKKLMRGNVKDLRDQINGEWATSVVALATVKTVIKEEETKEYQSVYNKAFLPSYALKNFRLVDYSSSSVVSKLRDKKQKELKPHERFVVNVTGEYGCKDFYILKDFKEYNQGDNLIASSNSAVLNEEDASY